MMFGGNETEMKHRFFAGIFFSIVREIPMTSGGRSLLDTMPDEVRHSFLMVEAWMDDPDTMRDVLFDSGYTTEDE